MTHPLLAFGIRARASSRSSASQVVLNSARRSGRLLLLAFSRLERTGTSNVSTRRGFLRQAIGFVAAMSGLGASSCDGHKVAAPCPATRPNCGIVAIRGGVVAGGIHSLWETVRETPGEQGFWSTMAPVSTNLLPPGFWTFIDLDIAAVPRGSPSGCEESHVVLIPANGPSVGVFPGEVFYKRQLIDGTWTMGFETLSAGLSSGTFSPGRPWRFGRISLARVNDELHAFRRSRKGLARAKSPGQSHASGWKRDSARVSASGWIGSDRTRTHALRPRSAYGDNPKRM